MAFLSQCFSFMTLATSWHIAANLGVGELWLMSLLEQKT